MMQAFSWICPTCGRRNFERAVAVEMTDEQRRLFCRRAGVGEGEHADLVTSPGKVRCVCEDEFTVSSELTGETQVTPRKKKKTRR